MIFTDRRLYVWHGQINVINVLDIEKNLLWLRLGTEFSRWFDVHCVVDAVTADHWPLVFVYRHLQQKWQTLFLLFFFGVSDRRVQCSENSTCCTTKKALPLRAVSVTSLQNSYKFFLRNQLLMYNPSKVWAKTLWQAAVHRTELTSCRTPYRTDKLPLPSI